MKKYSSISYLNERQRARQARLFEKNKKLMSKEYLFSHVEFALCSNIALLILLFGWFLLFPKPWLETLISIDLISILFNGIIYYRKHTTY